MGLGRFSSPQPDGAMPVIRVHERDFDVDVVVFDKDGTLVDLDSSWGPMARSWVAAVAGDDDGLIHDLSDTLGLDLVTGRLVPDSTFAAGTLGLAGDVTRDLLLAAGWSLHGVEAALERARTEVDAAVARTVPVTLADVGLIFTRLAARGVKIAIFTSDDRGPTVRFLEQVGVLELVSVAITADDVEYPKPHPDGLHRIGQAMGCPADRIVLVGDSMADQNAARAAGAWFIAVGHGTAAAAGSDATVSSIDEVGVGSALR